ncbi:hypothetical protein C2G38_2190110 [Gigaspora rosea]|uniref:Uncharacterized protein n=1 Tax=Gigaspora rosea TaxID=44941 RepID=A0A397V4W0_9GLOM|nr:hypothetical protein C2G38_2190110 [Gigaspora rosea]
MVFEVIVEEFIRTDLGIPDEVGLKASMLDPQVLKLLPFTTNDERKNTETQLRAELAELEAQFNQNNDNDEVTIITKEEECDSLSAELWAHLQHPFHKEKHTNFPLLC